MSFGDLERHGHFNIIFLGVNEVVMGQVQHPITYFTRPWGDFMVHGVNSP